MAPTTGAAMVVTTIDTQGTQQTFAPLAAPFHKPGIALTARAD
jgi:hypothetical protein